MQARRRRWLTILLCGLLAAFLARFSQGPDAVEGLLFDTALVAHARVHPPPRHEPGVLIVGLDEASLSHPEMRQRPRALFGPVWAQTLTALRGAGAKVIVFDFILAFSGDDVIPGYDRDFLRTLYAAREHTVLARSQSLLPAKKYMAALGFSPDALGLSELNPDADGVYRKVPLYLGTDEKNLTLAAAALRRAGVTELPASIRLAPVQPIEALPTYALADILDCARSDPAALAKAAGGKIVFIGTTLQDEDRKLSPSRFFPATGGIAEPCAPATRSTVSHYVSGVYLHALAADMVLGKRLLADLQPNFAAIVAGLAAALATAAGLIFRPAAALLAIAVIGLVLWSGEVAALGAGIFAAMGYPILLSAGFGGGSFLLKFLAEERRRMHVQKAFGHYLAPELVKRLSEREAMPVLGGEMRHVSIMFADLSGFTALSSKLPADEIVALTNQYLSLMAEEIEASQGYIDKYIGDAVMAIWGAPITVSEHARLAVTCALRIARRIREAHAAATQAGMHGFSVKIGINSGMAVLGNVGAHTRLNYTAVGDTVNVAARLESVPGDYGCMIVVGEQTAASLGDAFILRELDRIAVKGRETPLAIFEPLQQGEGTHMLVARYAQALAFYRDRNFQAAMQIWQEMAAQGDRPSEVMALRARELQDAPPPPAWDGVWRKTAK